MKKSTITIEVELDENNVPEAIHWDAQNSSADAKAIMISVWDPKEMISKRVDLWTKEMKVDEMKLFFYQTLLTMGDSFKRATNEENIVEDLKDYCSHFAEKMELFKKQ